MAQALSKKQLAEKYHISSDTLNKWLRLVPDLKLGSRRILTPREVERVFDCHGEPD